MENKAQFKMTGNVEIYSFPSDKFPTYQSIKDIDKKQYLIDKGDNMVVDYGLDVVKNLLIGASSTAILYNGVGSSSTAVTSANTDLGTAIGSRLAIQTSYSGGTGIAKFDTFYTTGDNNGSWNEAILSQSSSGANAFARKILSATYTKSTSNTALITWTITITVT